MPRTTSDAPRFVYAKDNMSIGFDGSVFALRKGDIWPADDPAVIAHPEAFSDEPPRDVVKWSKRPEWRRTAVEQATAAPGELRNR